MLLRPEGAAQRAVFDKLYLLSSERHVLKFGYSELAMACRESPDYALRLIRLKRADLIHAGGTHAAVIGEMVRRVEWEFAGAEDYLREHHNNRDEEPFVERMLMEEPQTFTRDALLFLVSRRSKLEGRIPDLAAAVLASLD